MDRSDANKHFDKVSNYVLNEQGSGRAWLEAGSSLRLLRDAAISNTRADRIHAMARALAHQYVYLDQSTSSPGEDAIARKASEIVDAVDAMLAAETTDADD